MTGWSGLFSVVVLCTDNEVHRRHAIESIQAQTLRDFEIIAVGNDDLGCDARLLESLAGSGPERIQIVPSDASVSAALNAGAEAARGQYLSFLLGEDAYHPERLEVFRRAIDQPAPLVWGFSGVEAIGEDGQSIDATDVRRLSTQEAIQLSCVPLQALRALNRKNTIVSAGNLVVERNEYLGLAGFRDLRFAHGWDLALRLLERSSPYVAERPLYRYRLLPRGVEQGANTARLVRQESAQVLRDYRARTSVRIPLTPLVAPLGDLLPDEALAIKATLWAMTKLRAVPPVYAAVRSAARVLRKLRGH